MKEITVNTTIGEIIPEGKKAAKYKIGQVAILKSIKNQPPFRIIGMQWDDGWFYQWNKNNYAAESMVRELTPIEKGESCPKPPSEVKK